MEDLSTALRVANISFPGGRIRKGPLHLPLRILGEFENLDEIRKTEIPAAGPGITIGDLAEVVDTIKEPEGFTLIGDEDVVSLHLYKEVGENTISATAEVDVVLDILADQYPDFDYSFIYKDAEFVQESFKGLEDSLKYGAGLAFLVLFFFLMNWRSPLVVGLAIPVSIMTTFAFLYFADVGLNLMSLGGLSLAAGMLVDNSIVVLENINRHLKLKRGSRTPIGDICSAAAAEVASPVIAATLTTVAVFFPVIYVPGIAGEFFRDQALTVTISLVVSIFAALLLQPMLSAHILKTPKDVPSLLFRPGERAFQAVMDRYHGLLGRVMDHKAPRPAGPGHGPQGRVLRPSFDRPGRCGPSGDEYAPVVHARPHSGRFHPGDGIARRYAFGNDLPDGQRPGRFPGAHGRSRNRLHPGGRHRKDPGQPEGIQLRQSRDKGTCNRSRTAWNPAYTDRKARFSFSAKKASDCARSWPAGNPRLPWELWRKNRKKPGWWLKNFCPGCRRSTAWATWKWTA